MVESLQFLKMVTFLMFLRACYSEYADRKCNQSEERLMGITGTASFPVIVYTYLVAGHVAVMLAAGTASFPVIVYTYLVVGQVAVMLAAGTASFSVIMYTYLVAGKGWSC